MKTLKLTLIFALIILLTSCGNKTSDKEAYFGKYTKIEKTATDSTVLYGVVSSKGKLVAPYEYVNITKEAIDKGLVTLHKRSGEKNYLTQKGYLLREVSSLDELVTTKGYNEIGFYSFIITISGILGVILIILAFLTIIGGYFQAFRIFLTSGIILIGICFILITCENDYMGGQKTKLKIDDKTHYGLVLNGKCLLENKFEDIKDFDKYLCYTKTKSGKQFLVDRDGKLYQIIN